MSRDGLKSKIREGYLDIRRAIKWSLIAVVSGLACGIVGGLFVRALGYVTALRMEYPAFMLLLPVGGAGIYYYYHLLHNDKSTGVNIVITSIQSGKEVPGRMLPSIFLSSIFSHLCGASVGREGAALQLGGSIGHALGGFFRMNPKNRRIMVMSGMAGAFSAVFGTPVTAIFFSMELTSIGYMNYAALLPCSIASFTARGVARNWFGVMGPFYRLENLPAAGVLPLLKIALLAVCCGLVSILFCVTLRQTARYGRKYLPNRYIRALVFGSALLLMTLLTGWAFGGGVAYSLSGPYNGTGAGTIRNVVESGLKAADAGSAAAGGIPSGRIGWYTFLLKILFTDLSLAAGYKGGEIVPTFFIGSTFGYFFGSLIGFAPHLCAAVGMGAMFCGVTNAPVASVFLCIELFGVEGMIYYIPAIAIAYIASSYYGLYPAQKIMFSKYDSGVFNKRTNG